MLALLSPLIPGAQVGEISRNISEQLKRVCTVEIMISFHPAARYGGLPIADCGRLEKGGLILSKRVIWLV